MSLDIMVDINYITTHSNRVEWQLQKPLQLRHASTTPMDRSVRSWGGLVFLKQWKHFGNWGKEDRSVFTNAGLSPCHQLIPSKMSAPMAQSPQLVPAANILMTSAMHYHNIAIYILADTVYVNPCTVLIKLYLSCLQTTAVNFQFSFLLLLGRFKGRLSLLSTGALCQACIEEKVLSYYSWHTFNIL